jgi:hypothetical protein
MFHFYITVLVRPGLLWGIGDICHRTWYVLASAALYAVCPRDTRQEITSPVFNIVTFLLDLYMLQERPSKLSLRTIQPQTHTSITLN